MFNLVFLNTYTFTDQNGRPLEIEDKVNSVSLINKQKWHIILYNQEQKKYVRRYRLLSFARNLSNKYGEQLLDTATKRELDALKTASKKVAHKAAAATGEFIGNKIRVKIVKVKPMSDVNSRNVEEIIILPEKREEMLNELRQVS